MEKATRDNVSWERKRESLPGSMNYHRREVWLVTGNSNYFVKEKEKKRRV